MKTAVVFKWTRNPQDAIVSGGKVDWSRVKMAATDDDPAAIDVVKALCGGEDILGITIGDGKPEWAAARGAASTLIVEGITNQADGAEAAAAISGAIKHAGELDVVAIGDSDWDRAVIVALIGKLGWRAYAGVIEAEAADGKVRITVKTPDGLRVIETATPVLLCVQGMGKEQNAPGMKQTLAARKLPVEKISAAGMDGVGASIAESLGTHAPEGTSATLFEGEPGQAANQLVAALHGEGIL